MLENMIRKVDLSSSDSPVMQRDSLPGIAYGIVAPSVITFGIIGNILILVVLGCSKNKGPGPITIYLSALAVSDMGSLVFSIPLFVRLTEGLLCNHFTAIYYAHLELTIYNTFMASSIFIVVALTIERYISVCWPGKFTEMDKKPRAKFALTTAYILAVLISLPLAALKKVGINSDFKTIKVGCRYEFKENLNVTSHVLWTAYVWLGETLVRFLPGFILALLNCLIIIKFRKVVAKRLQLSNPLAKKLKMSCNLRQISNTTAGRCLEEERKLIILLTSIIVLFFVTNIPSAILSIIYREDLEATSPFQVFRAVANLLELSNFALNFFIYFLCSKEFRKMFFEIFNFKCVGVRKSRFFSFSRHTPPSNTNPTSAESV